MALGAKATLLLHHSRTEGIPTGGWRRVELVRVGAGQWVSGLIRKVVAGVFQLLLGYFSI